MAFDASLVFQQGKTVVRNLTPRQKTLIAASMIAVIGSLWLFVSLLGKGEYRLLYASLQPEEANTISKRLAQDGIPSQLSPDGKSLSVPAGRLDKARLDMAAEGFPQTGRLGFEIFNQPNWGESDFAEKVNYQRALEGELERTIQDLDDVAAVRVHLVLPHESLFSEREREAKASVLIKLRTGHLSEKSLKAITFLVSSAVDTLKPENVTVVDANGNVPIIMQGGSKAGSSAVAAEYEQALDQKLITTLTPILGVNHFVARTTVEHDPASSEHTQEVYDPKDSVVLTSQVTRDISDGSGDSGIPGAASNVPQDQAGGASNSDNAASAPPADGSNGADATADAGGEAAIGETSDSKTYAVGRTVVHTVRPPGGIRKISAAVLVDDKVQTQTVNGKTQEVRQARTPAEIKQIQSLAAAVLGLDPTRGDVVTVEDVPFQITPLQSLPSPSGLKRIAPLLNKYGHLFQNVILGLFGLLVFLFVFKPLLTQLGASIRQMPNTLATAPKPVPALAGPAGTLTEAEQALREAESALIEESAEHNRGKAKIKLLRENLSTKVVKNPTEASRLIEGWLKDGESD